MKLDFDSLNKVKRIEAVQELQILYSEHEEVFDNVVNLASILCENSAAAVVFANNDDGWLKSKIGVDFTSFNDFDTLLNAGRHDQQHIILKYPFSAELEQVPLFSVHQIKFYAAVPVKNDNGIIIGHLCVLSHSQHQLTQQQLDGLDILAQHVTLLLRGRQQIRKQVQSEQELKNNEDQINSIFYNAVDAVIVTDSEGSIKQWNPKAEKIFGWTANEVMGKNFHNLCLPERYHELCKGTINCDGKRTYPNETIEIAALRKDQTEFEIDLGLSSATINGSEVNIAFVSDNTDRKQVTDKLDEQKEFYENILNKLPTDIAVFDANHKYLFVNPGAISNEEYRKFIIGKDDYEYVAYRNRSVAVADTRRARFKQVKETGKEIRWEDSMPNPEGKIITHLRRMFPVHDENGELTFVIGFGMDITDRKLLEEKQSALVKQLSAQNAQLIDFCNIVSHNLRGPLVNMSMLVQFIEETADEAERKFLISKLQPVIDNLHTTFNELVESIQIKQDLEVQSEKLSLTDCVQRTLEGFEVEINKSGAVIETDFDEAPIINYPPKYLFSIFHNLIGNSLKYRSPERKPSIKLKTSKVGDKVILAVSDNGLGVDTNKHKDNLFKIGKVFHRHPNAKGFGLFMTKTQVEAMDGNIWVESTPGEGATFYIEFKNQNI